MATHILDSPRSRSQSALTRFFYAEEVPYGLALVRICMPVAVMCAMLPRWFYAREIYSSDGATAPLAVGYGFENLLPVFSGPVAVGLHSALILFLVTMCLGWCTRVSAVGATVLYTYLNLLDCISSITKYSVIATHVLFLLSLSNCGAVWSIDSWLRRRRHRHAPWPGEPAAGYPKSPVWPRRLIQFLVGAVYFGAAFTKFHTPAFFSGDQLQSWLVANYNFNNPLGKYLWMFPALMVIFAYVTIVWEILFVFLAWRGLGRVIMLTLGALFHLMTTVVLGLWIFPLVSLSAYLSFVDENDVQKFARAARRLRRRIMPAGTLLSRFAVPWRFPKRMPVPSPVLFAAMLSIVVVGGIQLEHRLDPYGERRPEGPYPLVELTPEQAAELLTPTGRIRVEDKLQSFDVGTFTLGGVLANRKVNFRHGDIVVTQCTFAPPHEDMWVECGLYDDQDRVVNNFGQVIAREAMRGFYWFRLATAMDPGEYRLIVKTAGREIGRRTIYLRAGSKSPVAN